ncbi:MAG: hypothetical protein MSH44_00570 [Christensenellaceae bacterium]|nr:hypothetical protein [Christensenellaceae bacterium]
MKLFLLSKYKFNRHGCALAKTDFCYETNKSGSYRIEFIIVSEEKRKVNRFLKTIYF